MTSQNPRFIIDVGMHNGDDSAYYLHLGYSVLGVDANPLLTAKGAVRFAEEIRQGRMKILNAGILKQAGKFIFYRNLQDDGWSSFDPARGREGGRWEEIEVPCVTGAQLIAEYGKPYYLKIDIEGADLQAIQSLDPATSPDYVSLELSYDEPIVEKLIELGYSAFKFVDGESYRPQTEIFRHELGWRLLRKASRAVPPVRKVISSLPAGWRQKREWNPGGKHSPDGYAFTRYSSGPFGENAAGEWRDAAGALAWLNRLKENCRKNGSTNSFWWDVHARHSTAQGRPQEAGAALAHR